MGKIRILPPSIVNKIAAGEVIDRPASIVKELIENSVDAGALQVKVKVEKGGTKKIIVTDDGEGMDKEDISKCFKRHGTSKISSIDDLYSIKSLGFRGEALSSIAAVSKMTIMSKRMKEIAGKRIELEAGNIIDKSSIGMPKGTKVSVRDLFYNLPARKKFLKKLPTEFRHILDIFTANALSHPEIGFYLNHNGKEILDLPKNQSLRERLKVIFGQPIFSNLIPVFYDHPHLKIKGFITKPQFSNKTSYTQYIFVNSRRVKDKIISAAVRKAYDTLLNSKSYPVFALFLRLPPDLVDINVHPRKEEVKFINSSFIFKSVKDAVSHALQKENLTFAKNDFYLKQYQTIDGKIISHSPKMLDTIGEELVKSPYPSTSKTSSFLLPWEEAFVKTKRPTQILQVHNLYLIVQTTDGILIFDQHAAHERVLYEKLLKNFQNKRRKYSQPLLLAETFDLPIAAAQMLRENKDTFQKLGFDIEDFGSNSFKVNSIPSVLKDQNIVSLITEVIDDLSQEKSERAIDSKSKSAISFLACRSAVKAGDPLTEDECFSIVNDLSFSEIEYTCPHGRPTKVEISLDELAKMFHRR